ncbi:MAG: hypothetical protein VX267_00275, partial [Candidatus Thermoplasmatota archaeon]|nr:hypothetical protein [Candidatus Thermoplasmatota archaeon]
MSFLVLWEADDSSRVSIDGSLADWDGVARTADSPSDAGNANIDIVVTAAQIDELYLSLLTSTTEPIFTTQSGHTLRILIDSDANSATGYGLPGFGADNVVEIYGHSQAVLSASLFTCENSRDRHDWNGFAPLTSINARATATSVEARVSLFDLGMSQGDDARLLWQTADDSGNSDMSDFVIGLYSAPSSVTEIVDQARQDANSHNNGVGMVIDGQFNDWDSVERESDDFDATNPHVDLREYAVAAQADETFFYLQVDGEVLNGIAVPAAEARSIPSHGADSSNVPPASGSGSQQSTPLPVDSSQDAVRVLIDTDNDASTGYRQFGLALGADRMVEITGHYGIITQRAEM